jgi:hypothetical protein
LDVKKMSVASLIERDHRHSHQLRRIQG